jgi:energy-coupling factor transport system ATP-binding protein
MNHKLELRDVSYVYGGGTPFEAHALNSINLTIESGSITGIIGHTGSGKSTLVRLFNGLERPTSGTVLLDGADIWTEPKNIGKIRFRVGLVMQYPEYQLFEETVRADIAFGPRNMGLDQSEIEERVIKYSSLVGLASEVLDKSPFELSGGQKRRVAIAGIMAMKPEILVLDEPAAGLDPEGRNNIFDAI